LVIQFVISKFSIPDIAVWYYSITIETRIDEPVPPCCYPKSTNDF
jgi:hypothetical protein